MKKVWIKPKLLLLNKIIGSAGEVINSIEGQAYRESDLNIYANSCFSVNANGNCIAKLTVYYSNCDIYRSTLELDKSNIIGTILPINPGPFDGCS